MLESDNIDENYAYYYDKFIKIIFCKKTKYINCTQILIDLKYSKTEIKSKGITAWRRIKSAKEIFTRLAADNNMKEENCKFHISNHKYKIVKGSYLHPNLVSHYLSWVSPEIGLYVSKIISRYISKEQIEHSEEINTIKRCITKKKKNVFIYVFTTNEEDVYKIGYTHNIKQRMESLQVIMTIDIKCLYFVESNIGIELEKLVHKELWENKLSNRNELFRVNLQLAIDTINRLNVL
jgi:hypothetical protein